MSRGSGLAWGGAAKRSPASPLSTGERPTHQRTTGRGLELAVGTVLVGMLAASQDVFGDWAYPVACASLGTAVIGGVALTSPADIARAPDAHRAAGPLRGTVSFVREAR
jgi:hypothetical protein